MIENYLKMWLNYAEFNGRATRAEYWHAFLANVIISFVFSALSPIAVGIAAIAGLYSLAAIVPNCSLFVRRLHDVGKSGKWWFALMIPIVMAFLLSIATAYAVFAGSSLYSTSIPPLGIALLIACGLCGIASIVIEIFLLVQLAKRGDYGPNRYGEDPRNGEGPMGQYQQYQGNPLDRSGRPYNAGYATGNERNPAAGAIKHCQNCGAQCGQSAYCTHCGTRLG
jgi:uncharacterized membrane protein YhaH (DUF805 family)